MNDQETTRMLERLAETFPEQPAPLSSLVTAARQGQRRKSRRVLAMAAASVALVLGGSAVVQQLVAGDASRPSVDLSTDAPPAPEGMRLVGLGRVVVAVPTSWQRQVTSCGSPLSDEVVFFEGDRKSCPLLEVGRHPAVQVLDVTSDDGMFFARRARSESTINGLDVLLAFPCHPDIQCKGVPRGQVLYVPSEGVVFHVTGLPMGSDRLGDIIHSIQLLPEGYTTVPYIEPGTYNFDAGEQLTDVGFAIDPIVGLMDEGTPISGTEPEAGSVVRTGTRITLLYPSSQEAPRDDMTVTPSTARPGDVVALNFPTEQMRGLRFVMFAPVCDDCTEPPSMFDATTYYLTSDANGSEPEWSEEPIRTTNLGVGGTGPDRVVIPDIAEPGQYMLCTHGAEPDVCAVVTVVEKFLLPYPLPSPGELLPGYTRLSDCPDALAFFQEPEVKEFYEEKHGRTFGPQDAWQGGCPDVADLRADFEDAESGAP